MGIISGNDATVSGENTNRLWRIEYVETPATYKAGNTKSAEGAKCGIGDWQGFYLGYGHTPAAFPGVDFTFTGSTDGSKGATGTAYCELIRILWDIKAGKLIEYMVQFSGNGALTVGAAVATDATVPDPPCTESMGFSFGTAVSAINYMELILRNPGKKYINSDTAGETRRKRGYLSGEFTVRMDEGDTSALPTRGQIAVAQFDVTDTLYWELTWGKIVKVIAGVDHESNEVVGSEVQGVFLPFDAGVEGSLTNPASTEQWPYSD